ncbi:tyrosine-type recombinase/integrase [Photobacterium swingsii]|uniref:tyrosine-type recombinase/integrase n=1 Tax=Photobacterium swingsii TaxID=680026 RepID=UPI0040688AA0
MKTKRLQMANGEKYSILLGKDGMPLLYENLFVTVNYRNFSRASNTCHIVFEHLRLLNEICDGLNLNLVGRCQTGNFLKKHELQQLKNAAKFDVEALRERFAKHKASNVVPFKFNANKIESARATIVIEDEGNISPHTAYNRVTTFAHYLGWLEDELCPSKAEDSHTEELLLEMRPDKLPSESNEAVDWQEWRSLSEAQVLEVLDVVRPDSSRNPWKNESVRYRNQLIFNFFDAAGCRRGELMKIRVKTEENPSDIVTNTKNGRKYLRIRAAVDKGDARNIRPEGKTKGRMVPMDNRLTAMYENYLIHHRPNATGSEFIPYLFVTHNHRKKSNSALSLDQVNKMFREVSEIVGYRVYPHAIRHTWNDRFSNMADRLIADGKSTETKTESDRRRLQGWSDKSKSGEYYAKRHTDKRAMEIGLAMQEKHSEQLSDVVGAYDEEIDM